ncbi:MAG: RHS repeat-associated core domain-containing protein [Armatimonadetes bacterium]|nr:RHS repeat-associated core domain-containing protein [Armatimonadota bacterium]MDE2206422.1 RHS repeat-associated core domain-containing protein [Armatimonadota bacterium]
MRWLGSARAETNSSGTATATQDFDAFGNTIASSGSTSSPYNFAGGWAYQSDGDAGLQHGGVRYYDPQVGRFASRDSMLDQIPYAYCGGEPNDYVDPGGHEIDWKGAFETGMARLGGVAFSPLGPAGAVGGPVVGLLVGDVPWDRFTTDPVPEPSPFGPGPWPYNGLIRIEAPPSLAWLDEGRGNL